MPLIIHARLPLLRGVNSSRTGRMPVATLILACRESPSNSWSATGSSTAGRPRVATGCFATRVQSIFDERPNRQCGPQEQFTSRVRSNGFVFLILPFLSLDLPLGVTASPHRPFPTDFVTSRAPRESPPLRLGPCSRTRVLSLTIHISHLPLQGVPSRLQNKHNPVPSK